MAFTASLLIMGGFYYFIAFVLLPVVGGEYESTENFAPTHPFLDTLNIGQTGCVTDGYVKFADKFFKTPKEAYEEFNWKLCDVGYFLSCYGRGGGHEGVCDCMEKTAEEHWLSYDNVTGDCRALPGSRCDKFVSCVSTAKCVGATCVAKKTDTTSANTGATADGNTNGAANPPPNDNGNTDNTLPNNDGKASPIVTTKTRPERTFHPNTIKFFEHNFGISVLTDKRFSAIVVRISITAGIISPLLYKMFQEYSES